jgi:hypothetical protein
VAIKHAAAGSVPAVAAGPAHRSGVAPFGLFGQLDPPARQLFILALDFGIANATRELPTFCRAGAEFFGSRSHAALVHIDVEWGHAVTIVLGYPQNRRAAGIAM